MFTAMVVTFVPLLAPANQMSYDTQQFYNPALAIVAGVGLAALSFRLLPPLSPALRTRRLLALTLARSAPPRDGSDPAGRRTIGRAASTAAWRRCRTQADGVAALRSLWRRFRSEPRSSAFAASSRRLGLQAGLDAALEALAQGNSAIAIERLALLDRSLAALPGAGPGAMARAAGARRASLQSSEALSQHAAYFDAGAAAMSFTEINLFGVYVAPISLMMVAAWLILIVLRRIADRFGLLRHVWHPALFVFAVYMIVLSSIVLILAR